MLLAPSAKCISGRTPQTALVHHRQGHPQQTSRIQRSATTVASAVSGDAQLVQLVTSDPASAEPSIAATDSIVADVQAAPQALGSPAIPNVSVPDVQEATQQAADQLNLTVSKAAAGVTDKAAELADAANKATATVTGSANKAAEQLSSAVSGATSSVTNTLSGIGSGVSGNISNLTSSVGQGIDGVTSKISSATGQLGEAVGGTLSGINSSLGQATAGVSGTVGQTIDQVTAATQAAANAVSATVSSGQAAVQQTLDSVSAQVSTASSQVVSSVDATTQQVLESLPAPVKEALVAAGSAAAAAGGQVLAHPRAAAVLALAAGVPTAYRVYTSRYGGYAGEVTPEKALSLLTNDTNVFLVDIRAEEQREKEGLPQLKLAARFKVAAFPLQVTIPTKVAREAANADELRLLVNAAFIAGLPQCQGPLTKIVIMDSTGGDKARALARALTSLGQPLSYVMTGGFKAWAAAELPVVEDEVDYDASTGAVLSDNVEVLAERATEAVKTVSQPQVALPLTAGTALAAYAALNIHTTLQYIGVLGVLLTVTNKALSYDSPQEALEDAKGAVSGAQKALSQLGSLQPPTIKTPSLPKMPKMPQAGGQTSSSMSPGGSAMRPAAASSSSTGGSGGVAAALSRAAVGGGNSKGDAVDVSTETEQELVD